MWRDLWHLRAQALAIVLVMASGIATFIMSLSTLDSLFETRARFYAEYRFGDVFAALKRAPESLAREFERIDGVSAVQTLVRAPMLLRVPGFDDPVRALLISVPDEGLPRVNRLYLRAGRMPAPGAQDEIVIGEAFAQAHRYAPGHHIEGVVNGRLQRFRIVGIAISPEYVYQIQPGAAFPDFKRFAVIWMGRKALEAAYDMEGAFNAASLKLSSGASSAQVVLAMDRLLDRYGGLGTITRKDQLSHKFLSTEFEQLKTLATIFPVVFLSVAAFLLNVVFGRMIATQRDQIAILKAFGYSHRSIGLHYAGMVGVIAGIGALLGCVGGVYLGRLLANLYMVFYRFPFLEFVLSPWVVLAAVGISLAAALSGAALAIRAATRLPPAEAMRPEAPLLYRRTLLERLGLRRLDQPTRMILRHLSRKPGKAAFTVSGIAMACGVLMVGMFQQDALTYMVDQQFALAQRNDLGVGFVEPQSTRVLHELARIPGVLAVEGSRSVPVVLRAGPRRVRTGIEGLMQGAQLRRVLDTADRPQHIPSEGLLLTDHLARMLDVRPGDLVEVEALQGSRARFRIPVVGTVREYIGINAYLELSALNRWLGEGQVVSAAQLDIDPAAQNAIFRTLEERPKVASVGARAVAIQNFYDTMAESLLIFTYIATLLAATIAFGVLYNTARIALSERGRELASLRVLGYSHGEIAYILIGELAILTLAAIPVGWLFGYALCATLTQGLQSELFRVPTYITRDTYVQAATVVLASAVASAWIVRTRLRRLDLIEVLKTRE